MDEDNRSDEKPEEEDSDAGWYFDLPRGAWERQEAKNRELRQSVRRNMDTEEPKKDVFGGSVGQPGPTEQPPLFRPSHLEADDDEAIRRRWHFDEDDKDSAETEQDHTVWGSAGVRGEGAEYSTEPELPAPAHFRLRSQRMPEEDAAPHLTPPPGLFSEEKDGEQPTVHTEEAEAAPAFRVEPSPVPEEPRPFIPQPSEPPVEAPRSRWDEFFGEKAGEDTSMLDSMRSWATGKQQPEAHPGNAAEITSLEPPGPAPAEPSASGEPPAIPVDINAIPLRRRSHAEDEPAAPPAPEAEPEEPKSRWDEMFSAKAGDGGMLDSMRTWAKSTPGDDERPEPRLRLDPEPQDSEPDPALLEPFAWEQSSSPESTPAFPAEPLEDEKKGGLVGRLFGRKKKDDAPSQLDYPGNSEPSWSEAEDQPSEFPPALSFSDSDEQAPAGSWLGRSDGAENRFAFTADEPDAEPAEFRWQPSIGDDTSAEDQPSQPASSSGPWGAGEDWQPRPATPHAFTAPEEDDEADAAGEMAGWATAAEPALASAMPGPDPMPEEDPWQPVQAIEDENAAGPAEASPEDAPAPAWAAFAVQQEESGIDDDAPSAPTSDLAGDAEDDPWAAFIARRQAADEATSEPAASPAERQPSSWDAFASATASSEKEESSLWDSAFARIQGPEEDAAPAAAQEPAAASASDEQEPATASASDEQEPATASASDGQEPATASSSDDPWAAIARVSGYDAGSDEIAVYRGVDKPEEPAEPAGVPSRLEADLDVPDFDDEPLEDEGFGKHIYPDSVPEYPSSHGGAFRFDEDRAPVALPEWDDSNIEDDTVLRAFEAHASAYDEDDAPRPIAPVLHDLLGEDAEDVLAEASDDTGENQYFGRMQGWAPQRTGGRTPYPWEVDRDQPSREPDDRDDEDSDDWSGGGSQPPWSGGEMVSPAPHAGAPSVRHRSRSKMLVREIVETGLLALLVFLAVRASFQNFKVDGLSMWPTLEDGEYLIVNKLAYAEVDMDRLSNFVPFVDPGEDPNREVFGGPSRGDIVVLKDPAEPDIDLIKRIIGMPGETLEIVDGKVYINDHLLIEPYIKHEWHDTKPKIAIPDGYYFVMGDNRDNSKDSRNGSIGLIPKDLIIGKAMLTYWPKNKFGLAPNQEGDVSEKDGRPQITAQTVEP